MEDDAFTYYSLQSMKEQCIYQQLKIQYTFSNASLSCIQKLLTNEQCIKSKRILIRNRDDD